MISPVRRALPLFVLLCLLAACAGREPEPRTAPAWDPHSVLDVLKRKDPATAWDPKSVLHADLDLDGTEDYALSGIRKDRFVVGIVHGPLPANIADSRIWALDFPWNGGEDALCSKHAKISLEPLEENPGPKPSHPAKGMGINLHDEQCDGFHIYWDPQDRTFEYWRL
jgi:hypothetical protein